jgi:aryl-alcohol dehydrogenase-like predicted oxidoreductase
MQKRRLSFTDLALSVIGFGTSAIGSSGWAYGWGVQDEGDSISSILEGLQGGINWIDTAPAYGCGVAETVVGKAIREWKDQVIVATKCSGITAPDGHSLIGCLKKECIIKECEDSLRRLRVEAIDLYQIHFPDPELGIEEGFLTLLELQKQGKIKWPGVSNFSLSQLELINSLGPCASLQAPYSLIRRDIENDILPWCAKHNLGVLSYSPLQCGLLTGKVTPEWIARLPDDDWRKFRSVLFREPKLSRIINLVDALRELALSREFSLAQLAISWVLRRPEINAAIVGARKKGQISSVISANDLSLAIDDIELIDRLRMRHLDL